jgi:hypothetical protein
MSLLYQPPPGYYDLPMIWIYDGSALTDGTVALPNQQVPIFAGFGDFVLRRIVGLNNVLSKNTPNGQFQVRDAVGRYIQSVPQNIGSGGPGQIAVSSADIAVIPELLYRENRQIYFDLYNILRAVDYGGVSHFGAQIGFQGVRRLPGAQSPFDPTFTCKPKTFTYTASATLSQSTAIVSPVQHIYTTVLDYDFELHEIQIVYTVAGGPGPGLDPAVTLCQLFDQNNVACSYQPVTDQYINSLSAWGNGALVPPLLYRVSSQIRMDVVSLVGTNNVTMLINYVGKQRIPC